MEPTALMRAFEMLIVRLGDVEDAVARTERAVRDQAAAADVREIMLIPPDAFVGAGAVPRGRHHRLCERLEDILHESVDTSLDGPRLVAASVARLLELGACRITYLMLGQMLNMTDDMAAVLNAADDTGLVDDEDRLAFALRCLEVLHTWPPSDRRTALMDRAHAVVDSLQAHWGEVGYTPGEDWTIAAY